MSQKPDFGAFVVSLDFEIHWGVRDHFSLDHEYRENLLGERQSVPAMLQLFEEFEIAATWATVGFLFAESKEELEKYKPPVLPDYNNKSLFPYDEKLGQNEDEDPFHFAPSLIELIKKTPRQEIGTHTFSHYFCLEAGQSKESFAADLKSAVDISKARNIQPKTIIFPRNQHNTNYEDVLLEHGVDCFRGNQKAWMYQISQENLKSFRHKAARVLDAYVNLAGFHTADWDEVWKGNLANVPASFFLRPVQKKVKQAEQMRLRRLSKSIEYAAKNRKIFHLWWHPHNFGVNLQENLDFLRRVFEVFAQCREKYGMKSMTMTEVAAAARPLKEAASVEF
jgi:hypothetical protein